ncbi:BAG family molecular chaperone regulator 8, chloroplastic-like [Nymphaea colorata]|nr:BAG family molecular chaperone regulator 8, chloroplastic-like [Nymphaea colorata]XP_049935143.1 BAG family molecular chaperone regulator 8, chloroplastic-like [Nymphaea colorata]
MAGNHYCHHHHHHHQQQCCCCCCYCCSTSSFIPPPSPPPTTIDSGLLTIASYLAASLQQPQSPPPPPPTATPPSPPQSKADPLDLQSLLHRVSTMESALRRLSLIPASPSPPPASSTPPRPHAKNTQIQTPPRSYNNSMAHSLRDHAARTIQTHFRAFLLRRSQMLRHLKLIAFAQTFLNNLRLRLSDQTQLALLCRKEEARRELVERTADLLAKVDAIRTGDSMIMEAKRSVSRDLAGVLDVLNGSFSTNDHTRRWVASESNNGGAEKVGRHFSCDGSFNHDVREHAGSGRETGFIGLGKAGEFSPDIGGRDGTECKSHVNNDAPNVKKIVEALDAGDNGGFSFEEKSEEDRLPVHWEGNSFGLAAPLPLQMEPRSTELLQEFAKQL